MPDYCSASNCTSCRDVDRNITFHRFPLKEKEEDRFSKWLHAVKRKDFHPTQYTKICSLHFTAEDYNPPVICGKPKLKKSAVPSIFNFSEHLLPNQCQKRMILQSESAIQTSELPTDEVGQCDEDIVTFDTNKETQTSVTTREISTQTELTVALLQKRIQGYQKQRDCLQKKVGRQKKRISDLKNMLKLLKDNGIGNNLSNTINSSDNDLPFTLYKNYCKKKEES